MTSFHPYTVPQTKLETGQAPSQGQTNGAPVNVEGPQLALEQQGTDAEGTGAREAVKSVDASAKMQRAESPFRMPSLKWVGFPVLALCAGLVEGFEGFEGFED